MSMSEVDRQIVAAAERALELAGGYFKDLVLISLKHQHNSGLEVVASDPEKFHATVIALMGGYSATLLETVIFDVLKRGDSINKLPETGFADGIRRIRESAAGV